MKPTHLLEVKIQNSQFEMRKVGALLLAIALFVCVAHSQTAPPEERRSEIITPGIEHLFIQRGAPRERWRINVLLLDPQRVRVQLGLALDELAGAETTSSLAARHGALAAINGGYFRTTGLYRGEPLGALALGGKVLSEPAQGRAELACAEQNGRLRAAAVRFSFKAELKTGKYVRSISGFNRPREQDELIVFTPEFHRTTLTAPEGVEAIVVRGRVQAVREGAGSQVIPPDGWIISAHGQARAWVRAYLKRGARVAFKAQLKAAPPLTFRPAFVIGGGPRLLVAGQPVTEMEGFNQETFYHARHPRTALGWRADGWFVLVTVDGRQPQRSVGMTIPELAALLRELGCVEAINLDGGGSTTMVVKNKIVNSPSDAAGERAVSDALLIFLR
jgi:hypothetical protein